MRIKHEYVIEGKHSETDLASLVNDYGYNFTEEHLTFIKSFPELHFEGSRIVKIDLENTIGTSIIHNFFSASDLVYVLGDEAIMEAFEDLPNEKVGPYCILAFSHTETEIFIVGCGEENKNNIYIYSSITDELVYICNGLENFINNYLILE